MTQNSPARQPRGIRTGGQFAPDMRAEPQTSLTPVISVPSDPQWYKLVYEDRPSNGERRSYARIALEESLAGDDFSVVHDEDARKEIQAEAERDDSVDRALSRVGESGIKPHQFGAAAARELKTIRERRLAVESHYVPTASETFETAAAKISAPADEYRRTLEEVFPHVGEEWHGQMMKNHGLQPEGWQRRELHKLAVANERLAAAKAPRPEISEDENPDFTSHPVTPLESRIDALIFHRGDPTSGNNVRYLAQSDEGAGYGTVNIKEFAEHRLRAWRHAPIDRSGKA